VKLDILTMIIIFLFIIYMSIFVFIALSGIGNLPNPFYDPNYCGLFCRTIYITNK